MRQLILYFSSKFWVTYRPCRLQERLWVLHETKSSFSACGICYFCSTSLQHLKWWPHFSWNYLLACQFFWCTQVFHIPAVPYFRVSRIFWTFFLVKFEKRTPTLNSFSLLILYSQQGFDFFIYEFCIEVVYCVFTYFMSGPLEFEIYDQMLTWVLLFFKVPISDIVDVVG